MTDYVIRRLALMIPTILFVLMLTFLTIRLTPGSVVDLMVMEHLREQSSGLSVETPLDVDAVKSMLGLDVPWYRQFINWLGDIIFRFDFGDSLWTKEPVLTEFSRRLPVTFELGLMSFLIAQLVAIPVGIYSAIRQNSLGDTLGRSFAIFQLATPNFWIATMIMVFPSIWWGWSPPITLTTWKEPGPHLIQFGIPALLVGWDMSASTMRMLRTTLLDVLRQDYIRTAWAKGLPERMVILRHALRNGLMPIVTMVGGQIPVMWGGVVIMETIFQIPGMGQLFTYAIFRRDFPYTIAGLLIFSTLGLVLTLVEDMSYAYLDPRVKAKAFR